MGGAFLGADPERYKESLPAQGETGTRVERIAAESFRS